jgi:mRNA-degrading endonuclease toxin of MazEF toxin-antitoxin module
MEKEFDRWNELKKITQRKETPLFYHEREIWWCTLGINVGSEQNGSSKEFRRPVLILKGFGRATCLVIPLTTSKQEHSLRPSIGKVGGEEAHALLSQMRIIDTKRLVRKIGVLEKSIFEQIRKTTKALL